MFEVFYRENMINYMDNVEIPSQIRRHPDWNDREIMQSASRVVNRKFSSPQEWDNFIFMNPKFTHFLRNMFISLNEMMSWTSMFTEALPIPVKRGGKWTNLNTDTSTFAGSFLSIMASYAAVATVVNAAAGEGFDPNLYNPITTDYDPTFGVQYNPRFMSPAIPGLKGRGGRNVRLDLVGQADTAFRWMDPEGMIMSRLSVPIRGIQNQLTASNYWGEPLDGWKKLVQGATDISPIFASGVSQAVRNKVPGADEFIPEEEGRLGAAGQMIQSGLGINLRADTNADLLEQAAQTLHQTEYLSLEPYQRQRARTYAEAVSEGEFRATSETAARRKTPWGPLAQRRQELDDEETKRFQGLAEEAGNTWGRDNSRKVISKYFDVKAEIGQRRDEARQNLGEESTFEAEGELEQAMDGYYAIGEMARDAFGNFDSTKYRELQEIYFSTLTRDQQSYVFRNTNMTELPEPLLRLLAMGAPSEFQKITASQQARRRHSSRPPVGVR